MCIAHLYLNRDNHGNGSNVGTIKNCGYLDITSNTTQLCFTVSGK